MRGTTSRKIVELCRDMGAREVHMRVSCPPTIGPCRYGIDTPHRDEPLEFDPTRLARRLADRGHSDTAEQLIRRFIDPGGDPDQRIEPAREMLVKAQRFLASSLWRRGRLDLAQAEFKRAIELGPGGWRTHVDLGRLLMQREDYDGAARSFGEALRLRPEDPDTLGLLALARRRQGRLAEAARHYAEALRLRPTWPQVANNLAWLLATADDPATADAQRAVRIAEQVCDQTARDNPVYLETLAAAYSSAGRSSDAAATLREAIGLVKTEGEVETASRMRATLSDYASRDQHRKRAATPASDDASLWSSIAGLRFPSAAARHDALCALAWELATDANPRFRDGHLALQLLDEVSASAEANGRDHAARTDEVRYAEVLAAAHAELGRFERAEEIAAAARRAAERNDQHERADEIGQRIDLYRQGLPARTAGASTSSYDRRHESAQNSEAFVLSRLAGILTARGYRSTAAVVYEEALRFDPQLAAAHTALGHIWMDAGDHERAAAHLTAQLRLMPDDPDALAYLALCLRRQGRIVEAVARYGQALQHRAHWPEVANNLAWLHATQLDPQVRNPQRALRLARRACDATGHRNAMYLGTLAAAWAAAGKFDEARELASRAQRLATADGELELADALKHQLALYAAARPLEELAARTESRTPNRRAPADPAALAGALARELNIPLPLSGEWIPVVTRLAWLLATHEDPRGRDGRAAAELARLACEATSYGDLQSLDALAAALAERGQFEQASETAERAVRLARATHSVLADEIEQHAETFRQGVAYREAQTPVELGRFTSAGPANRQLAYKHYFLGKTLLEHGRNGEGWRALRLALKLDAQLKPVRLAMGRHDLAEGRAAEAAEHFAAVLRLDPKDSASLAHLALARRRQGRIADAVAHYTEALRRRPNWPEVANNLAWLLATSDDSRVRNPDEAVRLAEAASRSGRHGDAEFLETLAAAYAAAGRFDDAIRTVRQAIEVASSTEQAARVDRLRDHLKRYEQHQPFVMPVLRQTDSDSLAHLALARRQQGRIADAIQLYREALNRRPNWAQVANNLAWLLATDKSEHGDPDNAVELAQRACELTDHRQPVYLETLAVAYAAAGRHALATQTVRRAIKVAVETRRRDLIDQLTDQLRLLSAEQAATDP